MLFGLQEWIERALARGTERLELGESRYSGGLRVGQDLQMIIARLLAAA